MMKKIYIEFLRIIGILLVIFNHTGYNGFLLYLVRKESILYPLYMFCSVGCKVAIFLFLMITGAVLIEKEETYKTIILKRALKIVLLIFIFSIIQYFVMLFTHDDIPLKLSYFLNRIYSGKFATAYWYLYLYLGILIMLPIVRILVQNMKKRDYYYIFTVYLAFRLNTVISYILTNGQCRLNGNIEDSMIPWTLVYVLLGHYIANIVKDDELSGRKACCYLAVGFGSIILTCVITQYRITIDETADPQGFYNSFIMIPSAAIFYSIRYFFSCKQLYINENVKRIICTLGSCTLGVMLIENILRDCFSWIVDCLKGYISKFPACIVWVITVYIFGVIITLAIKRIPVLKKLL